MRVIKYSILVLLLISVFEIKAQLNAGTFGKVNIASPNAAALGKYGDIPVNYHTGVPNISIPLYSLKAGPLSLPIQLSYHAGGLRVDENASWVGAGWSLMAGGAITRTVKDKPDERRTQSMQQLYGHFSNYGISNYILNQDANSLAALDQEPDMFSFSFNGYSGKFVFDESRKPVLFPEQDIKIEYKYYDTLWVNAPGISGSVLGKNIESFILTTPDGTKYYFGISDQYVPAPYCDPIEVVSSYTTANGNNMGKTISSWYLNKIVAPDGVNQITLQYKRENYAFYTYPSSVYGSSSGNSNIYYGVKNLMAGVQLSKISSPENTVEFVPGIVREDLSRWATGIDESITDYVNQTATALGSIKVYDTGSYCIKKFNFSYGYFQDNTTATLDYFNGIFTDKKRLKLNSLQEVSGDSSITIPAHIFDYFNEAVPRRLSFGKDHWGFINGANSNTMLYPEVFDNNGSLNSRYNITINNRESAWPAMRGGSLQKITYPTGGFTEFEFEPNSFSVNGVDKIVGGMRIKSITSTDPIMNIATKTNYDYTSPGTGKSSGVLFSKPMYIQLLRNDWQKKLNPLGTGGNGCFTTISDNSISQREFILSDNTVRPMETTQGNHIGYAFVKVSKLNNGYSTYQYLVNTPQNINWGSGLVTNYINNPGPCDINIPTYPAPPSAFDFARGDLQTESHYDSAGVLLSQKQYQTLYQQKSASVPGRVIHQFSYVQAGSNSFITYYAYKTARKTETTTVEKKYDANGSYVEQMNKTLYASSFHNEPTTTITFNSLGDSLIKKNVYAFDMRSPAFDNQSSCNNGTADFMSFLDIVYNNYASSFLSNTSATNYLNTLLPAFSTAVFNPRKTYTSCMVNTYTKIQPLNAFQQSHDSLKTLANKDYKSILWMQDIYKNALLETTEWKNSTLLNATQVYHTNDRQDSIGIYPVKLKKTDLSAPITDFSNIAVNTNSTDIIADTRYADVVTLNYYKGNPTNQISRDGINTAYDWNYNKQQPTVKIINAYNLVRESYEKARINTNTSFILGSSGNQNKTVSISFTHVDTADITFSLVNAPNSGSSSPRISVYLTVNGPGQNNANYSLCINAYSTAGCSNTQTSVSLPAMLPGNYTVSINASAWKQDGQPFDSYQFIFSPAYSYMGKAIITTGAKEYYYEGFEESIIANNNGGYTGIKSYSGNFTVSFVPPNTREYIIEWWNYANGKWNFNRGPYTINKVLNGIIDEIRVFPKDAQMTTYTYDSRFGLTGVCDMNHKKINYEYDSMGRLKLMKDQDGNIVKTFDYNYKN